MGLLEDFSAGLFIWQSLLFVGLVFVLRKFAWKPILDAVNEREESIEKALESAEEAKKEMAKLKASNENLLKEAREERDNMLKEAKAIKEKMIADAKGQASAEAEKLLANAREAIENEKLAAITELKNQVATLSIEIAEKILKKELSSEDKQKALINNLVEEVNLN